MSGPRAQSLPLLTSLVALLVTASTVRGADGPHSVALPNGVTLELIGVSTSPSRDRPWWKPDGSAMDAPPYEFIGFAARRRDRNTVCYELAVRVSGLREEQLHRSVGTQRKYYVNGGSKPFAGDAEVEGVRAFFVHVDPREASVTLELDVAAHEWRTVQTFPGPGEYGQGLRRVKVTKPDPRYARQRDGTVPTLHVSTPRANEALRLVAVDDTGRAHVSTGGQWWGGEEHGAQGVFPDLPPERVKEYRLEACPYHPVVFRDVSLRPGPEAVERAAAWRAKRLRGLELKALADPQTPRRIEETLTVLRQTKLVFDDVDGWAKGIRDATEIGPAAVPALVAELNRTARPYVRSNLAIALRSIGDPRAVPGLAAALRTTPFAPNDYGTHPPKDPALRRFISRCCDVGEHLHFGRPVNEITETLESLSSGHSEGDAHRMKNERALQEDASMKWYGWFEQNRPALLRGLPEVPGAYDADGGPVDLAATLDGLERRLSDDPDAAKEKVAGEWTRLHAAALSGRLGEASLLLANGADRDAAAYGYTPLHLAAAAGSQEVVALLLEKGADAAAKDGGGNTPLHAACGLGVPPAFALALYQPFSEAVRALVEKGAEVNGKNARGQTPLHGAAAFDEPATLAVLLGAKADPKAADAAGRTPLHRAAECGAAGVTEALIGAGADVNAADAKGFTPIQAAGYSIWYHDFNPPMVPLLLARGARISMPATVSLGTVEQIEARLKADPKAANELTPKAESDETVSALHMAVRRKQDAPAVVKLLLDAGADPDVMRHGQTPLVYAVQQKRKDLAKLLLDGKAEPDKSDNEATALSWACHAKDLEMVRLLLDAGANPNRPWPTTAWSPLSAAMSLDERERQTEEQALPIVELLLSRGADPNRRDERYGWTPIFGRGELIGSLLLKHGAKLDVRTKEGDTPLHYAAHGANEAAVRFLLGQKVDLAARNDAGQTPLHAAMKFRPSAEVVGLLIKAGADVNATDPVGRTALHGAAERGGEAVVTLLLDAGCDPNARERDGVTPLHLAAKARKKDVISVLLARGAEREGKDNAGKAAADWAVDEETKAFLDK